jgi:intracellular multiplication protein IcmD
MTQIFKGLGRALSAVALMLFVTSAFADGDVTALVTQVTGQANSIATLLNVASYVAGVGFALAGVLQFKAHKENPQQVPLSKPIVLIIVAASLLFLPSIMNIAGQSLFGSSGQQASKYKGGGS